MQPEIGQDRWAARYGEGVRRHIDYPDQSVLEAFEAAAERQHRRPCTDFMGRTRSFDDIALETRHVASGLWHLGVRPGDRVAIGLPTCPQSLVALLATWSVGAVAVLYNPLYTADELHPQFADHDARVAIVWDKAVETARHLRAGTALERIVEVDLTRELPLRTQTMLRLPVEKARDGRRRLTTGRHHPSALRWSEIHRAEPVPADVRRPTAQDPAVILYTSGTTGKAKGAVLSHANLLANCRQGVEWASLDFGEHVFLSALPMFHALGLTVSVLVAVINGCVAEMVPSPDPGLMVEAIARRKPTFITGVPPMFEAILERAQQDGVSLEGITYCLSGAMALDPDFVARWEAATGGWLIEGYGLTEGSPIVVGNPISDSRRPGAIGVPFPDTEIRVVDHEDPTRGVPEGEVGELLVRGPQVFGGYLDQPEETRQAFVDGWLRTGDLVRIDDGFLVVTGRVKEIIVTGGFNVSPAEVEKVLRKHPAIEDAVVVGLPSRAGEDLVAAVVSDRELPPTEELRAWCKEHLAAYKVPRRFERVDELPTNVMGKVVRADVKERLASRD